MVATASSARCCKMHTAWTTASGVASSSTTPPSAVMGRVSVSILPTSSSWHSAIMPMSCIALARPGWIISASTTSPGRYFTPPKVAIFRQVYFMAASLDAVLQEDCQVVRSLLHVGSAQAFDELRVSAVFTLVLVKGDRSAVAQHIPGENVTCGRLVDLRGRSGIAQQCGLGVANELHVLLLAQACGIVGGFQDLHLFNAEKLRQHVRRNDGRVCGGAGVFHALLNEGVVFQSVVGLDAQRQAVRGAAALALDLGAQVIEEADGVKRSVVELHELLRTAAVGGAGQLICPDASMEEVLCEKNILVEKHLFSGGADLGAAGVVHAGSAAALVVQGGDLVNAKDDLVNVALVGVVVLAHHSRVNLAESGLRLHVVAGQIFLAERVVIGSGQLHRADRENAVRHIVFRLLEVSHGHIGQVVVGLPAFGDLSRNARGGVSGVAHCLSLLPLARLRHKAALGDLDVDNLACGGRALHGVAHDELLRLGLHGAAVGVACQRVARGNGRANLDQGAVLDLHGHAFACRHLVLGVGQQDAHSGGASCSQGNAGFAQRDEVVLAVLNGRSSRRGQVRAGIGCSTDSAHALFLLSLASVLVLMDKLGVLLASLVDGLVIAHGGGGLADFLGPLLDLAPCVVCAGRGVAVVAAALADLGKCAGLLHCFQVCVQDADHVVVGGAACGFQGFQHGDKLLGLLAQKLVLLGNGQKLAVLRILAELAQLCDLLCNLGVDALVNVLLTACGVVCGGGRGGLLNARRGGGRCLGRNTGLLLDCFQLRHFLGGQLALVDFHVKCSFLHGFFLLLRFSGRRRVGALFRGLRRCVFGRGFRLCLGDHLVQAGASCLGILDSVRCQRRGGCLFQLHGNTAGPLRDSCFGRCCELCAALGHDGFFLLGRNVGICHNAAQAVIQRVAVIPDFFCGLAHPAAGHSIAKGGDIRVLRNFFNGRVCLRIGGADALGNGVNNPFQKRFLGRGVLLGLYGRHFPFRRLALVQGNTRARVRAVVHEVHFFDFQVFKFGCHLRFLLSLKIFINNKAPAGAEALVYRYLVLRFLVVHFLADGLALNGKHGISAVFDLLPNLVVRHLKADPPAFRDNALRDAHSGHFFLGENYALHQDGTAAALVHFAALAVELHEVIGSLFQLVGLDDVLVVVRHGIARGRGCHAGPAKGQALFINGFLDLEGASNAAVRLFAGRLLAGECFVKSNHGFLLIR
nr:MAG TPA: hypothetical protein [Caudoviricetes sp.]